MNDTDKERMAKIEMMLISLTYHLLDQEALLELAKGIQEIKDKYYHSRNGG